MTKHHIKPHRGHEAAPTLTRKAWPVSHTYTYLILLLFLAPGIT